MRAIASAPGGCPEVRVTKSIIAADFETPRFRSGRGRPPATEPLGSGAGMHEPSVQLGGREVALLETREKILMDPLDADGQTRLGGERNVGPNRGPELKSQRLQGARWSCRTDDSGMALCDAREGGNDSRDGYGLVRAENLDDM